MARGRGARTLPAKLPMSFSVNVGVGGKAWLNGGGGIPFLCTPARRWISVQGEDDGDDEDYEDTRLNMYSKGADLSRRLRTRVLAHLFLLPLCSPRSGLVGFRYPRPLFRFHLLPCSLLRPCAQGSAAPRTTLILPLFLILTF